jgi:hypothetical protein
MRITLFVSLLALCGVAAADELYVVPDGVETRWASPENPGGERGQGGKVNAVADTTAVFMRGSVLA